MRTAAAGAPQQPAPPTDPGVAGSGAVDGAARPEDWCKAAGARRGSSGSPCRRDDPAHLPRAPSSRTAGESRRRCVGCRTRRRGRAPPSNWLVLCGTG